MKRLTMLSGAVAAVLLVGAVPRAEAQWMYGYGGTLRYGYPYGRVGVTSVRGPFGGGVTVREGPFGGGAVSLRGPFGGRINIRKPGYAPVAPVPYAVAPRFVPQTVVNPAVVPAFSYSAAYRALIPGGYPMLQIGAVPYYYTPVLPPGCQSVVVGGTNLFVGNGVYYQPYFYGGRTVYVIVER